MIVEHVQNNKLQKNQNFQSLNTSFMKNPKMNISSLIRTVENSALLWTVEILFWMSEDMMLVLRQQGDYSNMTDEVVNDSGSELGTEVPEEYGEA